MSYPLLTRQSFDLMSTYSLLIPNTCLYILTGIYIRNCVHRLYTLKNFLLFYHACGVIVALGPMRKGGWKTSYGFRKINSSFTLGGFIDTTSSSANYTHKGEISIKAYERQPLAKQTGNSIHTGNQQRSRYTWRLLKLTSIPQWERTALQDLKW